MTMNLVSVMWVAWAAVVVIAIVLVAYRGAIARDEEGQIFLDEAFDREEAAQAYIRNRIARIQPAVRVCLVAAGALTLAVIGYYVWDAARALDLVK